MGQAPFDPVMIRDSKDDLIQEFVHVHVNLNKMLSVSNSNSPYPIPIQYRPWQLSLHQLNNIALVSSLRICIPSVGSRTLTLVDPFIHPQSKSVKSYPHLNSSSIYHCRTLSELSITTIRQRVLDADTIQSSP